MAFVRNCKRTSLRSDGLSRHQAVNFSRHDGNALIGLQKSSLARRLQDATEGSRALNEFQ
jgi:hypothetical protein